jgi:hypothetical protein
MVKGSHCTEEAKRNMSLAHIGKPMPPCSLEHRKNLSNAMKKRKHSQETKDKISRNRKGKGTQENHWNWQGGIWNDPIHRKLVKRNNKALRSIKLLVAIAGSHNKGDWELLKRQYDYTCPCCRCREPEIKLTEDHIIPISRGGSNYIENIQPLCMDCNHSKYTKIIKYSPSGDIISLENQ